MEQFNLYFNQIVNICIWFNKESKMSANVVYDGEESLLHIELKEGKEIMYGHTIENLEVKSADRVNLEMNRLIQFLLKLKEEI